MPSKKMARFTICVPSERKDQLDNLCNKLEKSVSSLVSEGIGDLLDKYSKQGIASKIINTKEKRDSMLSQDGKNHAGVSVVFANHKGGVGKTSASTSLAITAAKTKRVLVIDLDPQFNMANLFGYLPTTKESTIADYIMDAVTKIDENSELDDEALKEQFLPIEGFIHGTSFPNIDIILPKNVMKNDTFGASLKDANYSLMTYTVMDVIIEKIKALNIYDYIFIDCSPALNEIVISTLRASDWVIIPTDIDKHAFDGVKSVIKHIKNIGAKCKIGQIAGVLFNKANNSRALTKDIPVFKSQFEGAGVHCFNTVIPDAAVINNEKMAGRIAVAVKPTEKVTKKYAELYAEVVERIG